VQDLASPPLETIAFDRPGPGSWQLDAAHCQRPFSRYVTGWFPTVYVKGFRAGFARIGALLDHLDVAFVHGFTFIVPRPVGAPPDAKGPPPKLVFKLLVRLHPALRRRCRTAAQVFDVRPWRVEVEGLPALRARREAAFIALQRVDLDALDEAGIAAHLDEVHALMLQDMTEHFAVAPVAMVPVGDFLAHAIAWTGCTGPEALAALRGASPHSLDALAELDTLASALREDAAAIPLLDGPAAEALAALRGHAGAVGDAARRWLERVEHRIATGHDPSELSLGELPESLIGVLRSRVGRSIGGDDATGQGAIAALRGRVPEGERARFDELLAEARAAHAVRDGRCVLDLWLIGVGRRALLAAGRRLAAAGRLHRPEHVFALHHAEIVGLLRGAPVEAPGSDAAAAFEARRLALRIDDVPDRLGPEPASPPPPEWLPAGAARLARALGTYLDLMFGETTERADARVVRGLAASPGRCVGTARIVLSPTDFERVREGDILIARLTTPSYNVVLPLLGGLVTDRGGLLSHPAIVSREYGIPGVVGTREATRIIPDGARVEIDGATGTVRVL
jgi:rifampicin phosphotransferase